MQFLKAILAVLLLSGVSTSAWALFFDETTGYESELFCTQVSNYLSNEHNIEFGILDCSKEKFAATVFPEHGFTRIIGTVSSELGTYKCSMMYWNESKKIFKKLKCEVI